MELRFSVWSQSPFAVDVSMVPVDALVASVAPLYGVVVAFHGIAFLGFVAIGFCIFACRWPSPSGELS